MSSKAKALKGVKAIGFSSLLINILQISQLIILARILEPTDFGLISLVFLLLNFITLFSDIGIGASIIRDPKIEQATISSLFWLSLILSIFISIGLWWISPFLAIWLQESQLTLAFRITGFIMIVALIGTIYTAILEKQERFQTIAVIEMTSGLLGMVTAIILAVAGGKFWALYAGLGTTYLVKSTLAFYYGKDYWIPKIGFRKKGLYRHLSLGIPLALQRTINYIASNVDYLLIGRYVGGGALGYYTMAFNLANIPSTKLNPIASRVFFPLYVKYQVDQEKIRSGYLRMQEYTALINYPLLLGLAACAPIALPLILGETWIPSVLLLQILCFVGVARATAGTVGPLLLAKGRSDLGLKWTFLIVTIQVPGIYIGVKVGGVLGVAIAFVILQIVTLILNYLILVRTLLGKCLYSYALSIWPALLMSSIMATTIYSIYLIFDFKPSWPILIFEILLGCFLYLLMLWTFKKDFLIDMYSMLSRKNK